jgi:RHS repeat-associated protein
MTTDLPSRPTTQSAQLDAARHPATGRLVERYEYTPYGQRTVYSHGWSLFDINGDGAVDSAELAYVSDGWKLAGYETSPGDYNGDGYLDEADLAIYADQSASSFLPANDRPLAPDVPGVSYARLASERENPAEQVSTLANLGLHLTPLCEVGHQGLFHDEELPTAGDGACLIQNGARYLHPGLGRFITRDPGGYIDGSNLYQMLRSNPINRLDPMGTDSYYYPVLTHGDDFADEAEEGWKYVPSSYFYHRARATASYDNVVLHSYVFSKAYRVLWNRWGHATAEVTINIICDDEGNIDFDVKGNSSRKVSISRSAVAWDETIDGSELTLRTAASGSSYASGGPSISAGKRGIGISFDWPDAAYENTFQMGSFKWECVCLLP